MVNIKLLFIILENGYDKEIKYLLNKYGIKVKTVTNAKGTASKSVLSYFGLSETEKDVYMAIVPDFLSNNILLEIEQSFNLDEYGTGVAFTIPIASSNKFLSTTFKQETYSGSDKPMENKINFYLIITIVSEGYLEQVMTAAKRAGSSGGTAIKGRGLAGKEAVKILGFNIEQEKDIVLNIVSEQDKTKVMQEITKEVGIKTKGKGVCIALPIDATVGIDDKE